MASRGKKGGRKFALFFVGFWSLLTLIFDGWIFASAYFQWQAASYPATTGTVTHSKVTVHHGDESTTYGVDVRYTYEVGGVSYEGDRYRYGAASSSDDNASRVVASLPVGKVVDVYYNPSDPADTVLRAGLEGQDLTLPLFLMPFNVVMIGGWCVVWYMLFGSNGERPAGGAKIVERGFRTRVRLASMSPLAAAGATLGIVSFLAIFPVVFWKGFNPPLEVIQSVWLGVLAITLLVFVHAQTNAILGKQDLVLDSVARTVTLPGSRRSNEPIPIDRIGEIRVVTKHGGENSQPQYVPTLIVSERDGGERREELVKWYDRRSAESLVVWLDQAIAAMI